jgi:hypothetical protein
MKTRTKPMTTKTRTSENVLPAAVPGAEGVLANYDKLAAALHETSVSIPECLAEEAQISRDLGAREVAGGDAAQLRSKLAAIRERRETAVRKRAAASDGVTKLEGELLGVRRDADEARGRLAGAAVRELQRQWTAAVEVLARLHGEALALQGALHAVVSLPAPYRAVLNLQGAPTLQFALPVPSASLPVSMKALTALIDRIDIAAALASAIRTSREADARHYRLSLERRAPAAMPAVYAALRPISHWGATFDAGDLVDSSLINTSTLYRLQVARCIAAADRAAAA